MKRLLAYLIVILGLGFIFNINSIAKETACSNIQLKYTGKLLECLQKELRILERAVYTQDFSNDC